MSEPKTYDLSQTIVDSMSGEPITREVKGKKEPMTARDVIVQSFKIRVQQDQLTDDEIAFNRKICRKLEKAEDLTKIPLKATAVVKIKQRAKIPVYPYDVTMQIWEIFDGHPTQAEMDEV